MADMRDIVVLEPYYGGSHATFVDTLRERSRHRVKVVTMPARKWKWRMRGAAIWFAREDNAWVRGGDGRPGEVILANDMLSVADLRALLPTALRDVPIACYFHENQLTYPLPDERERDYQYGMTNVTSCLAADAVWFNSRFHREDFLAAADQLLAQMPDHVPPGIVKAIRQKSAVLPPPVSVGGLPRPTARPCDRGATILWSHRWEYDKNPEPFFDALIRLDEAGYAFGLVLVGEQFRTAPPVFATVWDRLQTHIVHAGYLASRSQYRAMLSRCDVVVSTAIQENFGIAIVEAMLAGCQPLLPNRLSYPELIPPPLYHKCLYPTDEALQGHLRRLLDGHGWLTPHEAAALQTSVEARFGAKTAVSALDDALAALAAEGRN